MNHNRIRTNYNRLSRSYGLFSGTEKKFTDLGLQMLNVRKGENVLEIGFGTGHSLVSLAHSASETGNLHGIDLSDGMIQVTNSMIARSGLSKQIWIHQCDAINLPFADHYFNALFISFTLELFEDKEIPIVLSECMRVLQEKGRLGIVALKKKDCKAIRIYEWFHFHAPFLVDCRPIQLDAYIREAGFEKVEAIEMEMWGLPVEIVVVRKHGTQTI
jgi:ubiquinone/menaquinone biosynthesis C-methylase UbiE